MTISQLLPVRRVLSGPADLEEFYLPAGAEHLRVNFVASLDGVVEIDGRSRPLGGPVDRLAFAAQRAVADVVMVGAGTARHEDYGPVRMDDEAVERRVRRGQRPRPPLAVVTNRGDLDPSARLFQEGSGVLVLTTDAVVSRRMDLAEVAELLPCGRTQVDVAVAVAELRSRGLRRVLCEGGPSLARDLFRGGLTDEMCLTISPMLVGSGARLMGDGYLGEPGRFRLAGLLEAESMLLARYQRPEPGR